MYNRLYALVINAYNDQGYTGIEPAVLSSAAGQKQGALTIRPHRQPSTRNNENYIDRRPNIVTTDKKIMNEL